MTTIAATMRLSIVNEEKRHENQKPMTGTDVVLAFVSKVKDTFKDEREKFEKFLEVMKNFNTERFNPTRGIEEVKELFKEHGELISRFNFFLPEGYKIKLPLEDEQSLPMKLDLLAEAKEFLCKVKARFEGRDHVYKSFLEVLKMCRDGNMIISLAYKEIVALLKGQADLLDELDRLCDNTSRTTPIHYSSAQNSLFHERSSAMSTVQQMHVAKRKRSKPSHVDHEHGVEHGEETDWREQEKDNRDYDQDVVQTLLSLKQRPSCAAEDLRAEPFQNADKNFGMHPKPSTRDDKSSKKSAESLCNEEHRQKRLKVYLDRDQDHDNDDRVKESQCQKWDKSTATTNKNISGPKLSVDSSNKYSAKPVVELDLSDCEQVTPSYRLLPEEFQTPLSSQRTALDAEVLNDRWVSVPSSSKNYSSEVTNKNPYKEVLLRCEDDRYELDMLLESAKSTIKRVEDLIQKIDTSVIERDSPIDIKEHLTARNLWCIEQLYGDQWLILMDTIREDPSPALRVILKRLKHKQEDWTRCRVNFNQLWNKVYAEVILLESKNLY